MTWRGYQVDRISKRWTEDRVNQLAYLRCVEGLEFDEIARLLGVTPGAAEVQARIYAMRFTPQAKQLRKQRVYENKKSGYN